MDIIIDLYLIPGRISPGEWRQAYQESLRLVAAYDFMDRIEARRNGIRYFLSRKTEEREGFPGQSGHGWLCAGDLRTAKTTGEFMLFEDICAYLPREETADNGEDILLSVLRGTEAVTGQESGPFRGCINIWGEQTGGGDIHIYLLAIACLLVSRFPEAAMVSGDISVGQCRRAVRWANSYLEKPIGLPDTGRMDRLLKRLQASSLPERDVLRAFYQLSDEAKDARMGNFLRREFTGEELYDFYRRRFFSFQVNQRGFARVMKEYLEMGFDFQGLCRIAVEDPDGVQAEPKEFLRRVVESKLHIRDKETCDFARTARERADREEADTEDELSARIFSMLTGMGNRNVNAFYPLENIREDCRKVFGSRCQVDGILERLTAAEREITSRRDSLQAILYDNLDAVFRQEAVGTELPGREEKGRGVPALPKESGKQPEERYEINSYTELADFVSGCRIKPELEEDLDRNFRMLHRYMEENFEKFRILKREERENCLIQKSAGLLLREEVWDRIFDRIMEDSYIERICGILSVNREKRDGELFCRSLFSSLQALDYYWEKTKT